MKTKRFFALALTVIMMFSLLPHAFAAEDITAMLAEYQKQAQAMQQQAELQQQQLQAAQQGFTQQQQLQIAQQDITLQQQTAQQDFALQGQTVQLQIEQQKQTAEQLQEQAKQEIELEKQKAEAEVERAMNEIKALLAGAKSTTSGLINGIPVNDSDYVDYVYMGKNENRSPIKWRVLGRGSSSWLLISADVLGETMNWSKALAYGNGTVYNAFSEVEQSAVLYTTKTESYDSYYRSESGYRYRAAGINGNMFLLSAEEAETYFNSDGDRLPGQWWLRSPALADEFAGVAIYVGRLYGSNVSYADFGARPAFQLNLSSVLFESAAAGSKSTAAEGGGDFGTLTGGSELKLTLLDNSRETATASADKTTVIPGDSIVVSYGNITEGDMVSALIYEGDTIKYYATHTPDSTGKWTMTLPSDLIAGSSYILKVFSEKQNGNYNTDYASTPASITLTVQAPTYTVTASANPTEGGTVEVTGDKNADGSYNAGASVTAKATANTGYTFVNWTENNTPISTDASYTFDIASNRTLVANFELISADAPTITQQPQGLDLIYGYAESSLSVTASAASEYTLSYQWYSNTTDSNTGGTAITGATAASYAIQTGKNAGTTEYYYCVVTGERTDNHEKASVTSSTAKVTVGKAANPAVISDTATVTAGGNTVDLSANVSNPEGTVSYEITGALDGCSVDPATGMFTSGITSGTCTVTVTAAGNENYESKTGTITVTVTEKTTGNLDVTQSGITYGGTLPDPVFKAPDGSTVSVSYSGTLRDGTAYSSTAKPTQAGNYTVSVTAETSTAVYSGSAEFTIAPATPDIGTVSAEDVTGTLDASAVVLKRSNESVAGTLTLQETALVCGINTYHWTFTPTDTNNYLNTSGTVEINVAHDWGEVTYTWAADNSSVTATRVCKNNEEHKETETVKTTSEGTAATCEAAGKVTYTAVFSNTAFEKQTKTVETPALGHEWMVREELWAGDYSSVTVTFVCENDPTHTKKETAASSESISGSVVTYTAAITLDGQEFPFSKSVDIAGQGYVFTHTTQVWVKGSAEGATFRVTRLGDDSWTYRLFTGIRVDGAPVSAYSKAPGSIILTLHPAYLESLSVGYHTLAVYFTDGEATADFLILPAGGSYYNNSTSERYTYVPPSNVPRTGDESNLMLWGMLAAVSLAGALLIIRRRKA